MKKNKTDKKTVSKMQTEVWNMKNKVYEKTKKMDCNQFFNFIHEKS